MIVPVESSEWAAPVVPVVKSDGSVRICGDFRLTVNKVAATNVYPLPRIEDLFASLKGGQEFTKLDVAHAYLQIPLAEASQKYVTINTHRGLFKYTRLPFGVSAAPAIFQRTMESILQGIPGVAVYIDDILVTGSSREDHLSSLDMVLGRLEAAGLCLKRNKCIFLAPSVEYLGHVISAKGLQPSEEKLRAIREAPNPTNASQLRSFLGMIAYYTKFIPNLASMLSPLYLLLQKGKTWRWGDAQRIAFEKAKSALTSTTVLAHYDPGKELVLACDASPYGIGAVLSHPSEDGTQHRPIAFASRTLAPAERNYSQLEREGLALVYGVKRFHQFLYGRRFTVISDHKPLEGIFHSSRQLSCMATARIQRWVLTLGTYDYQVIYKPGLSIPHADCLSQLPLPDSPKEVPEAEETLLMLDALETGKVTVQSIKQHTRQDPVLARVLDQVVSGWRNSSEEALKPYSQRKDELSTVDGCLQWGT